MKKKICFIVCKVELKAVIKGKNLYEVWEQINALKIGPLRKVEIINIEHCKQSSEQPTKE